MGKGSSKESFVQKHQYFDQMKIIPHDNVVIAKVTVEDTHVFTHWASNLLKAAKVRTQFMLIPNHFKEISTNYCGKYSQVQINYDCYYMNFKEQILQRKNQSCHFDESSLWYLLLCLVEIAYVCNQLNLKVGDIKPENILLNNDGKAKIVTQLSVPKKIDSYFNQQDSLLSPQQLQDLKKSYNQNKNSHITSESFSIGMLILVAGNLIDSSILYDYPNKTLNMIQLNRQLQFWQVFEFYDDKEKHSVRYSYILKHIISRLLTIDPTKRLTSLQLYNILQKYKKKIMNLQVFQISVDSLESQKNSQQKSYHHLRSSKLKSKEMSIENKTSKKNQTFNESFSFQNFHNTSFLSGQNMINNSRYSKESQFQLKLNMVECNNKKKVQKEATMNESYHGMPRYETTSNKKRKLSTTVKHKNSPNSDK